jgi:hypothetical protein
MKCVYCSFTIFPGELTTFDGKYFHKLCLDKVNILVDRSKKKCLYKKEYDKKHPEYVKKHVWLSKEMKSTNPQLYESRKQIKNRQTRERYATDPEFKKKLLATSNKWRGENNYNMRRRELDEIKKLKKKK